VVNRKPAGYDGRRCFKKRVAAIDSDLMNWVVVIEESMVFWGGR
jgi:hypothetical protein